MHALLLAVIFFTCIHYKLRAQIPYTYNDTIQILPVAFKDDRSFTLGSFEKQVRRYDNRSFFILDSRENIDSVVIAWLNSRNIVSRVIKEQMFETGDTIVESKSIERWMKGLRKKKESKLSDELANRFFQFIDSTKPTLLLYNECKWREQWTKTSKSLINYRVYATLFKGTEVVKFDWLRGETKEAKARTKERHLYPELLRRLFQF